MVSRRCVVAAGFGSIAIAGSQRLFAAEPADLTRQPANLPAGARASAELVAIDGKRPLIKRTYRPPNFETPLRYFAEPVTRNDAFFVRYHGAAIPQVDAASWRLSIAGEGANAPAAFSLAELQQQFPQVDVMAVCQCSGNRRGMFEPHVPGIQWGPGAMGNALWRGVRLRDVLSKAGVREKAVEVAFDGADSALLTGPDFVKSIPVWKALEEDALIAFAMNGKALPHWHGFPARLVVPGWTATYWVKHLERIEVLTQPSTSFWMKTGYRIPANRFPVIERFISQEAGGTTPITEIAVNSLIAEPAEGTRLSAGRSLQVRGIAWDGGAGIARVEYSIDGGLGWRSAELGSDLGRFSFREWKFSLTPRERGALAVLVRATNRLGATQPQELIRNPAGYHHNIIQRLAVEVV